MPETKRTVVFATAPLRGSGWSPFVQCQALYLLQSYLRACPEVAAHFRIDIRDFPHPGSAGITGVDALFQQTFNALLRDKPVVIAFSLYVWNILVCHEFAGLLKKIYPEALLVAGGPEVARREDFVREFPAFDLVVEGEGELPLRRLLIDLARGDGEISDIPGTSRRRADGSFVHHPQSGEMVDFDTLPNHFRENSEQIEGFTAYLATRGCHHRCTYCQWSNQPLRRRSPERILDDLRALVVEANVQHLHLADYDLLEVFDSEDHVIGEIIELLRDQPDLSVEFFVNPGRLTDPRLPKVLRDFPRARACVGVQSMNPDTLRTVGRAWSIADLPKLFDVGRELREKLAIELVYPLPGETPDSFVASLDRLLEAGYWRFQIFPLMILRGTRIEQDAGRLGLEFVPRSPYYCHQTPTFPFSAYLDIAGLSYVLTMMQQGLFEDWQLDAARDYLLTTPGVTAKILARLRESKTPARVFRELVEAAGAWGDGPTTQEGSPRGGEGGEQGEQPIEAAAAPSVDVRELGKLAIPAPEAIRAHFVRAGVQVGGMGTSDDRLDIPLTDRGADYVVSVMPASSAQPCYRATRRSKVSYQGSPPDLSVIDGFVDFLAAHEAASTPSAS